MAETDRIQRKYATYFNDRVEVAVSPDGLPRFTSVFPAPFMDECARQKKVVAARNAIFCDGLFITAEKRIRNLAFDGPREKTTTQFIARVCKNQDEARFVASMALKAIEESTNV